MANSELVDSLIDRGVVSKQITDTTLELEALDNQIIETIRNANLLNVAIGKATNARQLAQATDQAAVAQQKLSNLQTQGAILQERLNQAQARAVAQQQKATQQTNKLTGEYQKLLTAYNQATLAARNAGATFGVNSIQFAVTSQQVQGLRGQLDAIDQPLGNFQRNVGNYASGIGQAFTRAYSGIRTLANILPGVGISGLFLLAFQGLKYISEQLGLFEDKISLVTLNLKNLNDVNKTASDEYGKQSTALKILYQAATDVNNNMHDRVLAARELQKEFPDTFKNIQIETILNGNASKSYQQLTQDILDNAKARAAEGKIAELAGQIQEREFQKQKILSAAGEQRARVVAPVNAQILGAGGVSGTAGSQGVAISVQDQQKKIGQIAGDALREQDDQIRILKGQQDFLVKYAGGNNAIAKAISTNNTPKDPKAKDDRKQILEQQLKDQKLTEDQILNDSKSTLEERQNAINAFEVESYIIINKGENDKVLTTIEASNHVKAVEIDASKDRVKIVKDAQDALLRALVQGGKQQDDLLKQQIADYRDLESQRLQIIEQNSSDALSGIADQYSKGLITQKEYERQKTEIERQSAEDTINQQIITEQAIVDLQKSLLIFGIGNARDLGKAEQDLAKLKIKASKDATAQQLADAKTVADARKYQHDLELELANSVLEFTKTAIDGGFQKRLDTLKQESDAIDKNTQQQLDAVGRSVGSEKQKADQTALINAKAQQQKDVIAQKERKIQHDQAVFDKAFNIAKALESVALSEVKALDYLTNPLTAPLYPAIAALIGAIGAVNVATIIAQPIPAFKDGVRDKKTAGLGIWGEAGIELGVMPDGTAMLSPDKATLGYMPKGMNIFSHKELMRMVSKPDLPVYAGGHEVDVQSLIAESKRSTSRLETAFTQREKVSGFSVNSTRRARWESYKKRNLN